MKREELAEIEDNEGFLNMKGSQVNQQEGEANKLHEYIVSLFAHLLNNYFCVRNDKVGVMVAWHL